MLGLIILPHSLRMVAGYVPKFSNAMTSLYFELKTAFSQKKDSVVAAGERVS